MTVHMGKFMGNLKDLCWDRHWDYKVYKDKGSPR